MENDLPTPDLPNPPAPASTRDPLIRYSVFVALGCAAVCMVFIILYIFSYSLDSTLSFERHFDSYASGNTANLPTVLGFHIAQNRMFQQSCAMVAGLFFAFVGLALFLVGIQGTFDANGQVRDYAGSAKRLIPGGVILLASMIFVGAAAMHPVDFVFGPTPPTAVLAPTESAPATTSPTQSQFQTAPASQPPARLAPQSAPAPAPSTSPLAQTRFQPPAQLAVQPAAQPGATPAQPPALRPARRSAPVPVKQAAAAPPPETHRFQP